MATKKQAQKQAPQPTYGIVLFRGNRYFYKGVMFRRGAPVEVDLATRNHLVGTKHFQDVDFEPEDPKPIPVRRRGAVRVHRAEPGMTTAEGGASAVPENETGGDTEDAVAV